MWVRDHCPECRQTNADPVTFEEQAGTSSRLHPLQRSKFGELLTYARPGDTVHISEMFRLVRGTQHILDVLDVLHRDRLALRIHDGAFSAMDLTARHPRTGELLSTVKFMVQTLAAAGELQRDLQRELTYDGLRAAEAKGNKGGRRPASNPKRPPQSAPPTWAAAPLLPWPASMASAGAPSAPPSPTSCPTTPRRPATRTPRPRSCRGVLDMPGKVADFLRTAELTNTERAALDHGLTLRRGQGYTLRVSAAPAIHRQFLERCEPLDGSAQGTPAVPAQRKARREYENRVNTLPAATAGP
ncbi:recombinase family protein [Nonomuraea sp. B5E05]|uniref:recombinase family protein n=1 Tax=Nonomuraea sp. B5E05 TaxID=3153569 RepID=UPI00326171BF